MPERSGNKMGYVYNNSLERRTPLKARTPVARSTRPMKRSAMNRSQKPMNKVGPRTKKWRKAWARLKPELEKRGRTRCEFGFIPHECWGPLDPCHSKKRGKMNTKHTNLDINTIALGCRAVHDFLDLVCTHSEMELFVTTAITNAGGMIVPETRAA